MTFRKRQHVWTAVLCALAVGLVLYLGATVTLSMDDYYYRTFWMGGYTGFRAKMVEHYRLFNGRTLVHTFASLALRLGRGAVAVCYPVLTLAIPLALRAAGPGESVRKASPAVCIVLFTGLLFTLSRTFFRVGYLWFSAFANYVLPAAMLTVEILLLTLLAEGRRLPFWIRCSIPFWCLLCGGTTEQSGLTAIAVCVFFLAVSLWKNRRPGTLLTVLASLGAASLGVWTVFASPATKARRRTEALPFWKALERGLPMEAEKLLFDGTAALLLGFFLAVCGLFLWRTLQKRRYLAFTALGFAVPFLHLLGHERAPAALIGVFIAAGLAGLALALRTEHRGVGIAVLAGLFTFAPMLMTASIEERTMLPGLLLLTAAASYMMARLLAGHVWEEALVCALILTAALLSRGPELPGYWENHRLDLLNDRYTADYRDGKTDTLRFNLDYDHSLCYAKVCDSVLSEQYYMEYAGFDGSRGTFELVSEKYYKVYVDGVCQKLLAVPDGDGELLFHARLLEAVGGSVAWTPWETVLSLGNVSCRIVEGSSVILVPDGAGGERRVPVPKQTVFADSIFLPMWLFRDVFGLRFDVDAEALRVDVTLSAG